MNTRPQRYSIVNCCGDYLEDVIIQIPEGAYAGDYREKAIETAGFNQHICGSCYDSAYRANFVEEED